MLPFLSPPPPPPNALSLPETSPALPHPLLKVGQSFLAFQRYQLGADSALFSQDYTDPSQEAGMPYAPYTNEDDTIDSMGTYQQAPSADAFDAEAQGYQAQDY
ncbi:Hypothetical predicted protein [Podarcis lilfordi]|uniref:Uncharacterized protein n=1 Tax=Podarcis lilfordi TaxID=74358 RepID=A0AA35PHD4_9SAUR|nr:Hypothetical predicted protein [Podarcis lilfordi]